jgi:hypothetical protein
MVPLNSGMARQFNMDMFVRLVACSLLLAPALHPQQKYSGPKPAKQDIPYLLHADNLVETESLTAQQEDRKNETTYLISGENSRVKTPLASPILILDASKLQPEKLQLFRLESKNGHREITFPKKGRGGPDPLRLSVTQLEGTLYRLEAVDSLPNGEYSLTPEGSNQVFCFAVY